MFLIGSGVLEGERLNNPNRMNGDRRIHSQSVHLSSRLAMTLAGLAAFALAQIYGAGQIAVGAPRGKPILKYALAEEEKGRPHDPRAWGCDDNDPCTEDTAYAIDGARRCVYTPITDCVPCEAMITCPPVDLVFVLDTSGSMGDEAAVLCSRMADVVAELADLDILVDAVFLGITETPGGPFTCLTDHVVNLLGDDVPGEFDTCPFPEGMSSYESWGPATAIIAQRYSWREDAIRLIVPIADEGPCNGSLPDGCNDPGDDRDSITNAIAVAVENNAIVSPITGTSSDACVVGLAAALAAGTGGTSFETKNPNADLAGAIKDIVTNACVVDDSCDDGKYCTVDDRCVDGACAGSPRDCSELDDQCNAGLCDEETAACRSESINEDQPCDDGLFCSLGETCVAGTCEGGIPRNCSTEDDQCNSGICDEDTDECVKQPANENESCDDGEICTVEEFCDAEGGCSGIDVRTIECSSDDDCRFECNSQDECDANMVCDTRSGVCECNPELCLETLPGHLPNGSCYEPGDEVDVKVQLGAGVRTIIGGQFLITYDSDCLQYKKIGPCEGSIFSTVPVAPIVNDAAGTILYVALIEPFLRCSVDHELCFGDDDCPDVEVERGVFEPQTCEATQGTTGPAEMACATFIKKDNCEACDICFDSDNPANTLLTDDKGLSVSYRSCCAEGILPGGGPPELICPESISVNADPGTLASTIAWDSPHVVSAGCDGNVELTCTAAHTSGVPIDYLIDNGGLAPVGEANFQCTATNDCGQETTCEWNAEIVAEHTVQVELQLAPSMKDVHLNRCIEFEFFKSCFEQTVIKQEVVEFGRPFNLPGFSNVVTFKVPAGRYRCVTARDPLHTLRAVAEMEIDGNLYMATFVEDPTWNGNWLTSGNLNGDRIIDIVDHAIWADMQGQTVDPHTSCDTPGPHADINGDGIVDILDGSFIDQYWLQADTQACCPRAEERSAPVPITEISIAELQAMGLGDLSAADLNGDGVLNLTDVELSTQGHQPAPAKSIPVRRKR